MRRPTLTKAGALLLAAALVLVLAAPAAAAPARAAVQSRGGPSFFQSFVAWLAARLPGLPAGPTLTAAPAPLGPELDPSGATAATADWPVAPPQLGAEPDPDG